MSQIELFEDLPQQPNAANTIDRARDGHQWKEGNWHHRNKNGFYQFREGASGNWRFYIPWFSNDDVTCTVQVFDARGLIQQRDRIPIDQQGRITIMGRKYGRAFWDH